ncbi:MAG: hypothetical protein ABI624_03455 [Casimicrobiaceae bacterium]
MNSYNTNTTSWRQRILFAVATVILGTGTLELVAGAMKFPDPETMAVREQVLAAQSERAYQIRTLEQGQVRIATVTVASGI